MFLRILRGERVEPREPPGPGIELHGFPRDVERLLAKLLHPERKRRYQRAVELIDDLQHLSKPRPFAPLPPPDCFLDREEESRRAARLLDGGRSPRLVAVSGEQGAGKSALLRRFALDAQIRGYRTVHTRCYPLAPATLAPVRSVLEELIPAGRPGRSLRSRLKQLLEARELFSDSGPAGRIAAGGDSLGPERRRTGLWRFLDFLLHLLRGRRVALFFEDVHLADPLSVEFLALLVREASVNAAPGDGRDDIRATMFLSLASESPHRKRLGPLLETLETASPEGNVLLIDLPGLSEDTVERWLELALPDRPEVRRAVRSTCGRSALPSAVREAIRRASLPGKPAAAVDLSAPVLEAASRSGKPLNRQVVEETARTHARLGEFSRAVDLLRGLTEERLSARERARLHRRLGACLHRAGDLEEAQSHLERARALASKAGGVTLREHLAIDSERVEVACDTGDYARARSVCLQALERIARSRTSRPGDPLPRDVPPRNAGADSPATLRVCRRAGPVREEPRDFHGARAAPRGEPDSQQSRHPSQSGEPAPGGDRVLHPCGETRRRARRSPQPREHPLQPRVAPRQDR